MQVKHSLALMFSWLLGDGGEDQSEPLQKRVHKSVNAARRSAYATSRHQENQRVAVPQRKLSGIGLKACPTIRSSGVLHRPHHFQSLLPRMNPPFELRILRCFEHLTEPRPWTITRRNKIRPRKNPR